MTDPRKPLEQESYVKLLQLGTVIAVIWILVSIWVDVPVIWNKILLTAFVLAGALVLSWPVEKSLPANVQARIDEAARRAKGA